MFAALGDPDVPRVIRRGVLHEEVATRLRAMIVEGDLVEGRRVPEKQLCEQLGVSRTPLREALKILAGEGLITLTPNRGAVVTPLTAGELYDTVAVMAALERLAGERAAVAITAIDLAEIQVCHAQMRLAHAQGDMPAYFRLNQEIHRRIVAAAGNRVLAEQWQALNARVLRARYRANRTRARWDEALGEHDAILDALVARDGARLGALLADHLGHKLAAALAALEESAGAERTGDRSAAA